ncbi:MAG: helix-turn-helix domain containing protein [Acidimicrobiales bacterium]|nr:helix-turn-helix domain containing protein [Acidimicrobiales bacterium]
MTAAARPEPPATPKAAATRARLLEIAADLFIERGYEAVSLRDIAEAASVTKGAIYGHFRSKGQLLVEVIRTQLAERDANYDIDAAAADPSAAFAAFIDPGSRELRLLQTDAAAAARHDEDVAAGLTVLHDERNEWIVASLDERVDRETIVYIINALSAGVGAREAVGRPAPDPERWQAVVSRMFSAAMRTKGTPS